MREAKFIWPLLLAKKYGQMRRFRLQYTDWVLGVING